MCNNRGAQGFKQSGTDALAIGAGFNLNVQTGRCAAGVRGPGNVREIVFIIDNQAAVKLQGLRVVLRVERAENIDRAGETGHSQPAGLMQGMHAEPVRARVDKDAPGLAQSMPVGIRLDTGAQQCCGADQGAQADDVIAQGIA